MRDGTINVSHSNLPVISFASSPRHDFVARWSLGYSYPDDDLYTSNIGRPLTRHRLEQLFLWKNGGKLSRRKQASLEQNYLARYKELRELPKDADAGELLRRFGGGAIWRIFFLHCWRPQAFPIYDQHVHRAMEYIETGVPRELPTSAKAVLTNYTGRYLPFWAKFSADSGRDTDKALWVFGKFLKAHPWLLVREPAV